MAKPVVMTPDEIESDGASLAPGTIVQIPEGWYQKDEGYLWSQIEGSASKPITIEPMPGARVTLACNTSLRTAQQAGLRLWYSNNVRIRRGEGRYFRALNLHPNRILGDLSENRPPSFDLLSSPECELNQLMADNGGNGLVLNAASTNCKVYDMITGRVGWDSPIVSGGRGRGHGLYLQGNGIHVRGHVHCVGFGRSIQIFSTLGIQGATVEDCVMDTTAVPSAYDQFTHPFTFDGEAADSKIKDLVLQRCVIRNVRDGVVGGSASFGRNEVAEDHGRLTILNNRFLASVIFNGNHSPITWDGNYTIGRIRGGGQQAEVGWQAWKDDYVDNLEAYDLLFKTQVATPNNTWIHGFPYEEVATNLEESYWWDGFGWYWVYNVEGNTEQTVELDGFNIGEWVEVLNVAHPNEPLAIFKYTGAPVTLPMRPIVEAPIGVVLLPSRVVEKSRVQTFVFRRLYGYGGDPVNSSTFGSTRSVRSYLVRGPRGVSGEIKDLRDDVEEGFRAVEDEIKLSKEPEGYKETTFSGDKVTKVEWWVSSAKEERLKEVIYTYDSSGRLVTVVSVVHRNGLPSKTKTEQIQYSGNTEVGRTISLS